MHSPSRASSSALSNSAIAMTSPGNGLVRRARWSSTCRLRHRGGTKSIPAPSHAVPHRPAPLLLRGPHTPSRVDVRGRAEAPHPLRFRLRNAGTIAAAPARIRTPVWAPAWSDVSQWNITERSQIEFALPWRHQRQRATNLPHGFHGHDAATCIVTGTSFRPLVTIATHGPTRMLLVAVATHGLSYPIPFTGDGDESRSGWIGHDVAESPKECSRDAILLARRRPLRGVIGSTSARDQKAVADQRGGRGSVSPSGRVVIAMFEAAAPGVTRSYRQ
jgi:hypothetical protein